MQLRSADGLIQKSVLRLEVAGLAAVQAVILSVLAEANVVAALAESAVFIALAGAFFLPTDHAFKWFRHQAHCNRESFEFQVEPLCGRERRAQPEREPAGEILSDFCEGSRG